MKGKKKNSSIFDKCDVSASQEIYLKRCGFAGPGLPPPDSDPSSVGVSLPQLNDGIESHRSSDDSDKDSVIGSGYNDDAIEVHAIRFASPEESADTADSEDDVTDPTVKVVMAEKQKELPVESSKVGEDGRKKLKIPLRDVVKAIVMNSKNTDEEEEEEDKGIEKLSCVQILLNKGFKF